MLSIARLIFVRLVFLIVTLNAGWVSAAEPSKAVLVLPDIDQARKLPTNKFDMFYIVTADVLEDEPTYFRGKARDHVCVADIKNVEASTQRCMEQFRSDGHRFDYLANGGSEEEVLLGGKLRSQFGVTHGMREEQANLFVNKYEMKRMLQRNAPQIPTARFTHVDATDPRSLSEVTEKISFPFVLKPTSDAGAKGIIVVNNREEWMSILARIQRENLTDQFIAEEFIDGLTMRIDGYILNGEVPFVVAGGYNPTCLDYYQNGAIQLTASQAPPAQSEEFRALAQASLRALGYENGVFHLEAIRHKDTGRLYFLEVGARPGGGSDILREAYHYNFDEIHLKTQLGIQVRPRLTGLKKDYAVVDCPTLPERVGKKQKVVHFSYDQDYPYKTLCRKSVETPKIGQVYDTNGGIDEVAHFFFIGPDQQRILQEAEHLKQSVDSRFRGVSSVPRAYQGVLTNPHPGETEPHRPGTEYCLAPQPAAAAAATPASSFVNDIPRGQPRAVGGAMRVDESFSEDESWGQRAAGA